MNKNVENKRGKTSNHNHALEYEMLFRRVFGVADRFELLNRFGIEAGTYNNDCESTIYSLNYLLQYCKLKYPNIFRIQQMHFLKTEEGEHWVDNEADNDYFYTIIDKRIEEFSTEIPCK